MDFVEMVVVLMQPALKSLVIFQLFPTLVNLVSKCKFPSQFFSLQLVEIILVPKRDQLVYLLSLHSKIVVLLFAWYSLNQEHAYLSLHYSWC